MAYIGTRRRGFGDVVSNIVTGGDPLGVGAGMQRALQPSPSADFPGYCNWLPFSSFLPACQIPTAAAQATQAATDIQKAAGAGTPNYNPTLAAQQTAAYQQDVAALCQQDPTSCAQAQFASQNPNWAAALGSGNLSQWLAGLVQCDSGQVLDPTTQMCVDAPSGGLNTTTLIALGLVAGVGLLLVTSGGGRRRR